MDFPLAGAFQNPLNSFGDVFVVKLTLQGRLLSTLPIRRDSDETGTAVAVDAQGSA